MKIKVNKEKLKKIQEEKEKKENLSKDKISLLEVKLEKQDKEICLLKEEINKLKEKMK